MGTFLGLMGWKKGCGWTETMSGRLKIWSLSLKPLYLTFNFGPTLSNQTKTAQEGGSKPESLGKTN